MPGSPGHVVTPAQRASLPRPSPQSRALTFSCRDDGSGPDRSRADFWWCYLALQRKFGVEDTEAKLLEVRESPRTGEGRGQGLCAPDRARCPAAVERGKGPQCRNAITCDQGGPTSLRLSLMRCHNACAFAVPLDGFHQRSIWQGLSVLPRVVLRDGDGIGFRHNCPQ